MNYSAQLRKIIDHLKEAQKLRHDLFKAVQVDRDAFLVKPQAVPPCTTEDELSLLAEFQTRCAFEVHILENIIPQLFMVGDISEISADQRNALLRGNVDGNNCPCDTCVEERRAAEEKAAKVRS